MKLFSGPTILLLLSVVPTTTAAPKAAVRVGSPDQGCRTVRSLALPEDTACTLYKKDTQWEDGHDDQVWSCEFTKEQATVMEAGGLDTSAGINDMLEIDSIAANEIIDDAGVISGTAILLSSDFKLKQCNGAGVIKLVVPKDDTLYEVKELSEDDRRHYKARRARRRALSLQSGRDYGHRNLVKSKGTFETLVVRVIANNGNGPAGNEMELYEDIFNDSSSLRSQYAACSKDQLIFNPAQGYGSPVTGNSDTNTGVVTVNVDVDSSDFQVLEASAFSKASETYGTLSPQFDLVIFCQPSSGSWVGYAYVNDFRSFYNYDWCSKMSALVHEVGHNLGLHHSGVDIDGLINPTWWLGTYGDLSGMMGLSNKQDDGPDKCFNAAKNYQLGWYDEQKESYNPIATENIGKSKTFVMNGVNEYKVDGINDGELITLRLENDNGLNDYYIGYNRANGPNSQTGEAKDMIKIVRKIDGGPDMYGESKKVAALMVDESFTIVGYRYTDYNVIITYKSVTPDSRDATITVRTIDPTIEYAPTTSPTPESEVEVDACADTEDFKYKGRKKRDCDWVATKYSNIKKKKKRKRKRKKLCRKNQKISGEELRVFQWCPTACAKVNLGPCSKKALKRKNKNNGN